MSNKSKRPQPTKPQPKIGLIAPTTIRIVKLP